MTHDERAKLVLLQHQREIVAAGIAKGPLRSIEPLLAAAFAEVEREALERAALHLQSKGDKIAEDAKTIAMGARSGRRTFLSECPAWDTEQFVAGIVREDAAAISALKGESTNA